MAKLRRDNQIALTDDTSLRLRAAWLYHGHSLTQNEVAERLGIGRSTVTRLLEEAKKRGEVRVWIEEGETELVELAVNIEQAFGIDEVIVVPAIGGVEQAAKSVGLALGKFLSKTITDNMTIGVGWGRTLTASLASFHPPSHAGVKIMSLLGGSIDAQFSNPIEFSWRLAHVLNAKSYLFPAPLIVDSAQTKRHLIEDCGLGLLFEMAQSLDLVVVSAGEVSQDSTSSVRNLITKGELQELIILGCVGDVLCNFLDENGMSVPHPINNRVMSINLDVLKEAEHIVIASGGANRAKAILAAIRSIGCNTLITDQAAAIAILRNTKTEDLSHPDPS